MVLILYFGEPYVVDSQEYLVYDFGSLAGEVRLPKPNAHIRNKKKNCALVASVADGWPPGRLLGGVSADHVRRLGGLGRMDPGKGKGQADPGASTRQLVLASSSDSSVNK